MKQKRIPVDISTHSILKVLFIALGLFFLYAVRDVLAIIFVSLVFAAAMSPLVDRMQRRGIPRGFSILIIYLIVFAVFSTAIALLIPPVIEQLRDIRDSFPIYYDRLLQSFESIQQFQAEHGLATDVQSGISSLTDTLTQFSGSIFQVLGGIFGSFFTILGILVMTFYLTLEEAGAKKFIQSVAPTQYQPYLIHKVRQIQEKLGLWLRGQLILVVVIGSLSFVGLLVLGVDYALVLAMVAGISEFVPYVGPIIGAVPAVFLAFTQSPTKAVLVLILYIVIQQLENQIIVPKVMQKTVGLNPIVVLAVTLIGATLAGVVGVILAVPTATILSIFVHDFFEMKREEEEKLNEEEKNEKTA